MAGMPGCRQRALTLVARPCRVCGGAEWVAQAPVHAPELAAAVPCPACGPLRLPAIPNREKTT